MELMISQPKFGKWMTPYLLTHLQGRSTTATNLIHRVKITSSQALITQGLSIIDVVGDMSQPPAGLNSMISVTRVCCKKGRNSPEKAHHIERDETSNQVVYDVMFHWQSQTLVCDCYMRPIQELPGWSNWLEGITDGNGSWDQGLYDELYSLSDYPKRFTSHSTCNEGQNTCVDFSETPPMRLVLRECL